MLEVVVSGLVTGWAIAVPIGAVGVLLVALTARTSLVVGAAAALGVATVDGAYAAVAVVGGSAAASALAPVAGPLQWVSGLVLLAVAAVIAGRALTTRSRAVREPPPVSAGRAFVLFLGLTAVNPTTVVYFAAVVLGNRGLVAGPAEAGVFVGCAFIASASWQLTLAAGGAMLGRSVGSPRGRLVSGLVSSAVIAALALHTMLG